ncbi:hypothetical protein, partial [Paenibacillus jiagnxiensis]|uniref:hypothetical protein n=1 Tax=Paenibacillus jiagnxiensis TaxID=3228926 RepID=UPI00339E00E5
ERLYPRCTDIYLFMDERSEFESLRSAPISPHLRDQTDFDLLRLARLRDRALRQRRQGEAGTGQKTKVITEGKSEAIPKATVRGQ